MVVPTNSGEKTALQSLGLALRLAWDLGYIIALPAVLFGFGGAALDKYLQTSPLFVILGFACSITLSVLGVMRRVRAITGTM